MKAAIFVLAGTDTHADVGHVANALEAAKEFKEAGDEVRLIFDGTGTEWIPEFSKPDHPLKPLFDSVKDVAAGACEYCANAFEVKEKIDAGEIKFLSEYEGHPSFRKLVAEDYRILIF